MSLESDTKKFKGNQKHLDILTEASNMKSARIWNKFVNSKASDFYANLQNAYLNNYYLSGFNLIRANLIGVELENASLIKADLSEAKLTGANLQNANLHLARCWRTRLSGANLSKTNLEKAYLWEAIMVSTNLNKAKLWKSEMQGASLINAKLIDANLNNANLIMSNLFNANLTTSVLTGCKFFGSIRESWIIENVKCGYAYWDRDGKIEEYYEPGEFERIYGGSLIIVEYPSGIKEYEYHSIPYIISKINDEFGDNCTLTLQSIERGANSNRLKINVTNIKEDKIEIEQAIKERISYYEDLIKKYKFQLDYSENVRRELLDRLSEKGDINVDATNIIGSIIGEGKIKSSKIKQQNYKINQTQQKKIIELLESLINEIETSNLNNDHKEIAKSDIKTIETQINSPKPKLKILKESGKSLRSIIESTTGGIIAGGIIVKLAELLPMIFG